VIGEFLASVTVKNQIVGRLVVDIKHGNSVIAFGRLVFFHRKQREIGNGVVCLREQRESKNQNGKKKLSRSFYATVLPSAIMLLHNA